MRPRDALRPLRPGRGDLHRLDGLNDFDNRDTRLVGDLDGLGRLRDFDAIHGHRVELGVIVIVPSRSRLTYAPLTSSRSYHHVPAGRPAVCEAVRVMATVPALPPSVMPLASVSDNSDVVAPGVRRICMRAE